jgi:hypothetical protein
MTRASAFGQLEDQFEKVGSRAYDAHHALLTEDDR